MSGHDDFDENAAQRTKNAPYTPRHPVPTVQRYQGRKEERQAEADAQLPDEIVQESRKDGENQGILQSTKDFLHIGSSLKDTAVDEDHPYRSANRNLETPADQENGALNDHRDSVGDEQEPKADGSEGKPRPKDTSESMDNTLNAKQKRKNMKHLKRDHATREVTDPVTHMRVILHDTTDKELKSVPENVPPPDTNPRTATGTTPDSKSRTQLDHETNEQQIQHSAMEKLFPPPGFDASRNEIAEIYTHAMYVGMGTILGSTLVVLVGIQVFSRNTDDPRSRLNLALSSFLLVLVVGFVGGGVIWFLHGWMKNRIKTIWEDELWSAAREQERASTDSPMPESTQWLNSLLSSIWPLVNPDLFTSLADTLEDVMQASLPKLVRMVSVGDLGQGSESIRILGVRWLPTGAAAKSVSEDGQIKSSKGQEDSDRKVPGEGEVGDDTKSGNEGEHKPDENGNASKDDEKKEKGDEQNIAEGMEAEEGDFVNVEVAFSYRASSSGKSMKVKSKNAHLYLTFFLPGGIRFPVWVELRGIVGTMRMRLQLCPDPPFFALCTLTLLGQPKADLACVPLTKKGLNIMDLPLVSSFVQSSIDAALAEYVAPKSLTLDLKDMLVGDDFKKDTNARGVVVVRVKRGRDFKAGDPGLGVLKKATSDAYVAVGWAKFGKPVWSTRVIVHDMEPIWDETAFILVAAEELNAEERLRVQLWDSDRSSADDDLGRIEVDLKELMHNPKSHCRMWDRSDGFLALEGKEEVPGILDWSVGYYPKTHIQAEQLEKQRTMPEVNSVQKLKDKISEEASKKLREATVKDESHELDQQKAQMLKSTEDAMITSTPPLKDYPTGVFSIQIHQITGLEFEKINKSQAQDEEGDDTAEGAGDLPSSYATVILNHQTIFKTRTKPKNNKPFFNAGTERFVRDWRTTEIMVAVRDSRVHENDPLLGMVYLPLGKALRERSQVIDSYPLVGGIAYGRVRISMVFRSIQLQAPRELLGWDTYGTIEITSPITPKDLSADLQGLRLKLRAGVNRGKMYTSKADTGQGSHWTGKRERPVRLAVRKRYCSCMVVEFRRNNLGLDKTPAFAILWLKDIPDEEDRTVTLQVWRGDSEKLKRAETNCLAGDMGERAGSIEVPLKFYRGLGAYHHNMASKSPNMQDVFEVLSTANDNQELRSAMGDDEDDTSSDSDSSDDDEKGPKRAASGILKKLSPNGNTGDENNGPLEEIKDYKKHSKKLHRRHRGLMQWKVARTGNYLKTKIEHGKDHMLDSFKHHDRDPGIETEV